MRVRAAQTHASLLAHAHRLPPLGYRDPEGSRPTQPRPAPVLVGAASQVFLTFLSGEAGAWHRPFYVSAPVHRGIHAALHGECSGAEELGGPPALRCR